MLSRIQTDLAWESFAKNTQIREKIGPNIYRSVFQIKGKTEAERYKKQEGKYVTFFSSSFDSLNDNSFYCLVFHLSMEIRNMLKGFGGNRMQKEFSVLVIGLGNPLITADSLGPETVKGIRVTRSPSKKEGTAACGISVSVLTPNVGGSTGIDSMELIQGAISQVHPHAIIAVDALSAGSCERLASTVQLTDAGISPGTGLGARRYVFNRSTLGVPILSIGIPTVVRSSNLLLEALYQGGMTDLTPEMEELLDSRSSFFVMPKEIDLVLRLGSMLLSDAINQACEAPWE